VWLGRDPDRHRAGGGLTAPEGLIPITSGSGASDLPEPSPADPVDDLDVLDEGPARRYGLAVVALVSALTLLVGLGAGLLLGRPSYPGDTSVDAGFARDMSTHHAQGVDMAMTIYPATTDPQLRSVTVDIGLTQQGQIGVMQTWLDTWGLSPTGSRPPMAWMAGHDHGGPSASHTLRPDGLMPGMATPAELERLRQATGKAKEILFLQLMIRHHHAGVVMAEVAVERATRPEVRDLAQKIIDGQQGEIRVLTAFLLERGQRPLPS
jgi:uncharacterized protein (DUF305 family)